MAIIETMLPLTETVAPTDEAAVVRTLRDAAAARMPVYPIGGGTRLDFGLPADTPGIGLSLSQLARVVDHAAEDMTITVEAGMSIAQLGTTLAAAGQRLPIDVAQADRATVGGVTATNLSGPRQYACGTMRDYLIGLRAVDGCGVAFSVGGRVVKNAAGYDLGKLMIGSLGTLGVMTQVTLMVRPLPETSAFVACEVADFDTAERLSAALVHSRTRPVAIEMLNGPATQNNPVLGPLLDASVARLLVGFEGSRTEVDWMVEQLLGEWRELGVAPREVTNTAEADLVWHWLTELSADVRIDVPPSATVGIIARMHEVAPMCSIRSQAGNGVIEVDCAPLPPDQIVAMLRDQMRPTVAAVGGKLVLLRRLDGVTLSRHDVWGPPGNGVGVMRAIKDRFDPHHLLNRGRYIFGTS